MFLTTGGQYARADWNATYTSARHQLNVPDPEMPTVLHRRIDHTWTSKLKLSFFIRAAFCSTKHLRQCQPDRQWQESITSIRCRETWQHDNQLSSYVHPRDSGGAVMESTCEKGYSDAAVPVGRSPAPGTPGPPGTMQIWMTRTGGEMCHMVKYTLPCIHQRLPTQLSCLTRLRPRLSRRPYILALHTSGEPALCRNP